VPAAREGSNGWIMLSQGRQTACRTPVWSEGARRRRNDGRYERYILLATATVAGPGMRTSQWRSWRVVEARKSGVPVSGPGWGDEVCKSVNFFSRRLRRSVVIVDKFSISSSSSARAWSFLEEGSFENATNPASVIPGSFPRRRYVTDEGRESSVLSLNS